MSNPFDTNPDGVSDFDEVRALDGDPQALVRRAAEIVGYAAACAGMPDGDTSDPFIDLEELRLLQMFRRIERAEHVSHEDLGALAVQVCRLAAALRGGSYVT